MVYFEPGVHDVVVVRIGDRSYKVRVVGKFGGKLIASYLVDAKTELGLRRMAGRR